MSILISEMWWLPLAGLYMHKASWNRERLRIVVHWKYIIRYGRKGSLRFSLLELNVGVGEAHSVGYIRKNSHAKPQQHKVANDRLPPAAHKTSQNTLAL